MYWNGGNKIINYGYNKFRGLAKNKKLVTIKLFFQITLKNSKYILLIFKKNVSLQIKDNKAC